MPADLTLNGPTDFKRCESISPAIVACQCWKEAGHEGDHINEIYGVFWPQDEGGNDQ